MILEHHSNVVRSDNTGDQLDPKELLEENWGAPVVITSMVQLLNTMFSEEPAAFGGSRRCATV